MAGQQCYSHPPNKETEVQQIQDLGLVDETLRFLDFKLKILYYNHSERVTRSNK